MIASDIGGTLTWDDGGIGKFTISVLNDLLAKEIPVAFLTGYNYHSARRYLGELDPGAIMVFQNGAAAIRHGSILWEHVFDGDDARLIVKEFQKWDVPVFIFRGSETGFSNEIVSNGQVPPRMNYSHITAVSDFNHILCISVRSENSRLEKISRAFSKLFGEKYHFILSRGEDMSWIEVVHLNTRKDLALQNLCERMRIDVKDVMYFGDNLNDLEVLKIVGYPRVVGNAVRELKQRFSSLELSSEKEVVAGYLNDLFDLGISPPD